MRLKRGVNIEGVHWKMFSAMFIIAPILEALGQECVVTSGVEGHHSRTSRHYIGCALDFRNRDLSHADRLVVRDKMQAELGAEFVVINEGNHFHIQWNGTEIIEK
jgi:hypothetical protein